MIPKILNTKITKGSKGMDLPVPRSCRHRFSDGIEHPQQRCIVVKVLAENDY